MGLSTSDSFRAFELVQCGVTTAMGVLQLPMALSCVFLYEPLARHGFIVGGGGHFGFSALADIFLALVASGVLAVILVVLGLLYIAVGQTHFNSSRWSRGLGWAAGGFSALFCTAAFVAALVARFDGSFAAGLQRYPMLGIDFVPELAAWLVAAWLFGSHAIVVLGLGFGRASEIRANRQTPPL